MFRPHGYGKMYRSDGSLVVSKFHQGVANGPSFVVFPDGSFYQGKLKNNLASDENGQYCFEDYKYYGCFKQNQFHGFGKEVGLDYTYDGHFKKGKRTQGLLTWTDQSGRIFKYQGKFNTDGLFEEGMLQSPNGTYEGKFQNGLKNGDGSFKFTNGMKYIGGYKDGKKSGQGTIYNYNGTIAYSGGFADDLPNGYGYIVDMKKKRKIFATFKDGLDVKTLENYKDSTSKNSQEQQIQKLMDKLILHT